MFQRRGIGGDQLFKCSQYNMFEMLLFFIIVNILGVDSLQSQPIDAQFLKEQVREMFHHGYDSYMEFAFPKDELKPLTCTGWETWGNYSLTLLDSLDTLAVLGNQTEFLKGVELVKHLSFDKDFNTSVFESNIRAVGGLISAHLVAVDPNMNFRPPDYNNELLDLAKDLADRLLPAFDTPTGMPYGTVNLKHGVPPNETPITSTAGTSTFSLEFGYLSLLTGDDKYHIAAKESLKSLWEHRSPIGLVGGHVNVLNGEWTHRDTGISGGVDSLYEYLLKGYILFGDEEYGNMFYQAYDLIENYIRNGAWYFEVEMLNGQMSQPHFSALQMFWPSLQVLLGEVDQANIVLKEASRIFNFVRFFPDAFHLSTGKLIPGREGYPLRPEFVESVLYIYRATKDQYWLRIGQLILESLQKYSKVPCGFANVRNVSTNELEDKMESFFLGETLKYLYLLFDDENYFNQGNFIFTTEAHPLPITSETINFASKFPCVCSTKKINQSSCNRFCLFVEEQRKNLICPNFRYHFGFQVPLDFAHYPFMCLDKRFFFPQELHVTKLDK